MDFEEIPDDIWISIFEQLDDSSTLAILVRTCRRFHGLASKLLLRELKWIKPDLTLRNLEAWTGVYSTFVALPRKITIGVPFEFTHAMRQVPTTVCLSAEMKLHDRIYLRLLRFTSITEICLDGTVISPYTYRVLGQIPTLHSLHVENCTFVNLHDSFGTTDQFMSRPFRSIVHPSQPAQEPACPLEMISMVPIKHLSLHRVIVPSDYENYRYHPLTLLTIPTLTSLSITWNATIAARYAQNRWALPSLTDLSVFMPLMSRDLLDELATFVNRCQLSPRFKLKIDKHNLSDTQMTTVQVSPSGLWNYEGPLVIVAGSATVSLRPTLTHVKINETLELPPLLDGLEKLPQVIEDLEVQVGKWDIELLFAIKELFKNIRKLVVRYVRGSLPENLLVRLGADILFCLPDLVSIKLLGPQPQEDASDRSSGAIGSNGHGLTGGMAPQNPPSLGHIYPHNSVSHVPAFHNGPTSGGHGYNNYELDFSADGVEGTRLNGEQDEVRFGVGTGVHPVAPHSALSHSFSLSSSPFQSNRSGLLSWNPTSSSRSSEGFSSLGLNTAHTSFSTPRSSVPSSSRRAGVFAKKQIRSERRSSKSCDKPETASPLSQAELGDYLVGWSRHCPSLRVVQIDHRWWWERRFTGDQWTLHVQPDNARSNDKGKEREGTFFAQQA